MNYSNIILDDIANGKGVRTTLFVSGCEKRCPGCFNSKLWDFNYGKHFTKNEWEMIFNAMDDYHDGITLLGGDPCALHNMTALIPFLREFKSRFPEKTIWCYTGYTFEELYIDEINKQFLNLIDVLIDGPFVEELKDLSLKFRGSSNQRIIDVKKTIESVKNIIPIVLYED